MADLPPDPDTGAGPGRVATTSTPRWVKVLGIIALVLILLVVVMLLIGGGSHGPGRHTSSTDDAGRTPPTSVSEGRPASGSDLGGHTPSDGRH